MLQFEHKSVLANGRSNMKTVHWTSKDLEILPEEDGTRYELFFDIARKLPGKSQNQ